MTKAKAKKILTSLVTLATIFMMSGLPTLAAVPNEISEQSLSSIGNSEAEFIPTEEEFTNPELNPKYDFVKSEKSYIIDHDGDGILERMVKFDRAKIQAILNLGQAVVLTLTGKVFYNQGLSDFEGKDTIRVIK